jgi:hypothetical protein
MHRLFLNTGLLYGGCSSANGLAVAGTGVEDGLGLEPEGPPLESPLQTIPRRIRAVGREQLRVCGCPEEGLAEPHHTKGVFGGSVLGCCAACASSTFFENRPLSPYLRVPDSSYPCCCPSSSF